MSQDPNGIDAKKQRSTGLQEQAHIQHLEE